MKVQEHGEAVFEGSWDRIKGLYVVRPGSNVPEVRAQWDRDSFAISRPLWQRITKVTLGILAFFAPLAGVSVLVVWLGSIDSVLGGLSAVVGGVVGLIAGVALLINVADRVFPSPLSSNPRGINEDVQLVPDEVAEWIVPSLPREDVWFLSSQMARLRDIATASIGTGWLYDERIAPVISDQWSIDKAKLIERAERLGFVVPAAYAADDPEELASEVLDD